MSDTDVKTSQPTGTYFAFDTYVEAIQAAFVQAVSDKADAVVTRYLPPENVQRFHHGGGWRHPGNDDVRDTGLVEHTAEHETALEDVVRHDLSMIDRAVSVIAGQMQRQFTDMLFSSVGKAAEAVGNSADGAGLSTFELYYRGLETVEVSANANFTIRWPQVYGDGGNDLSARFEAALASASEEDRTRLETLKAKKAEIAIARERDRQARFQRYGS